MAKAFTKSLLCAAAGICGVQWTPALATDGDAASIGDIVVTARRVEERLQDVPISITVFNQQQLANRNIFNAGDLGTYTPSLSTNSRYGAEKSTFAIRGFTQENGTAPSVGVYFADVVAPRAAGGTASGNGAGVGSLFDLANVQVLKGPQGTLFGRNTTGGAIILVPQKPTGRLEGYIEGTIGDYQQRRIQAVVNIPVMDTLRIRLGIDRNTRDGYLKNHSGIGPADFADTDYVAARFSAVADLTPNLENYFIATYSKSNTNGPLGRPAVCNRGSASPIAAAACVQVDRQAARGDDVWDVENDNVAAYSKIEQWQLINTTTWHANDLMTIKNIISYAEFRETTSGNIYGDNLTVAGAPFQSIITRNVPGRHNASQSTFTEELQFQGRSANDAITWQTGAYLELSNPLGPSQTYTPVLLACTDLYSLQCSSPLGATTGALSSGSFRSRFSSVGLYAQGTYKVADRLSVTGGIRYTIDRVSQTGENLSIKYLDGPNKPRFFCGNLLLFPGAALPGRPLGFGKEVFSLDGRSQCAATFRQASDKPTWLIDVDYKPVDDILLYAKYARGYRQGGVNTNAIGFETWNPEKVDTYEVGAKASFHGAVSGSLNIAGFYNKFSDQQIQSNATAKADSGLSGANIIVNAGKSTIKGVEVDAMLQPVQGVRFDVGYSHLDTKLESITVPSLDPNSPYNRITPTATLGGVLGFSPKNRYTVTGTYTLPLPDSVGRISVAATFTHTDSQLATLSTIGSFQYLPPSDLLNVNVGWNEVAGSPLDLAFFMTNVTNERTPVAIGGSYNSFGFETQFYAPPRMYGVRVRYSFGR